MPTYHYEESITKSHKNTENLQIIVSVFNPNSIQCTCHIEAAYRCPLILS